MNYDLLVRARKAVNALWVMAWLKGRCWGPKRDNNPYSATNITFLIGDELVSISQHGNQLAIHEFHKAENTKLGGMVKEVLRREGLSIKGEEQLVSKKGKPREPYFMWGCEKCKKRGVVEYEDGDDLKIVARRIYEEHAEATPGCPHESVKIIDHNLVEQQDFTRFISLARV